MRFIKKENFKFTRTSQKPIIIYGLADNHEGREFFPYAFGLGDRMELFKNKANNDNHDLVLHLGDFIEDRITDLVATETRHEAAEIQADKFMENWNEIDGKKEVVPGNRDLSENASLTEADWVERFGYEDREEIAGTKFNTAFIIDKGDIKALFVVLSDYSPNYNEEEAIDFVKSEVTDFDGDLIVLLNHRDSPFDDLEELLNDEGIDIPALFLHGHNHEPFKHLIKRNKSIQINMNGYLARAFFYGKPTGFVVEIHSKGLYRTYPLNI